MSTYRESEAVVGDEGGANVLKVYVPRRATGESLVLEIGAAGEKGVSVALVEVDDGEREYVALVDILVNIEGDYVVTANVVDVEGRAEDRLARTTIDPDAV